MNRDRYIIIATLEALAETGPRNYGPSDLLTMAESLASDTPSLGAQKLGLDVLERAEEAMMEAAAAEIEREDASRRLAEMEQFLSEAADGAMIAPGYIPE